MKQQFTILNVDKKGSVERQGVQNIKSRENNLIGSQILPLPSQGGGNYYYQSIHKKQFTGGTRIVKINKKRREAKASNLFCGECFISLDSHRQQQARIYKEGDDGVMYRVCNDRIELQSSDNEEQQQQVGRQLYSNKKVNVQYLMNQNNKNQFEECEEIQQQQILQPVITSIALIPKHQDIVFNNNITPYSNYEKVVNENYESYSNNSHASPEKQQQSYQRSITDYNSASSSNTINSNLKGSISKQQFRIFRAKDDFDKESIKKLHCMFSSQVQRPMSSSVQLKHEEEEQQQKQKKQQQTEQLQQTLQQQTQMEGVNQNNQTNLMSISNYLLEGSSLFNSSNNSHLSNQLRKMNQMSKQQQVPSEGQQLKLQHHPLSSISAVLKTEDNKKQQLQQTFIAESQKAVLLKNTPRVNILSPNHNISQVSGGISRPISHKEQNDNVGCIQDKESNRQQICKTKPVSNKQALLNQQLLIQQQKQQQQPLISKQQLQQIKQDNYRDFLNIINFSNNMISPVMQSNTQVPLYKVYIGLGNNGIIVRQIFKSRWWWQLTEDKEEWQDCQFLWMQWRRKEYTKYMKSLPQITIDKFIHPKLVEDKEPSKKKTNLEYSKKKGETYQTLAKRVLNDKDLELIDQYLLNNKKPFAPPLISKNYCCEKFCDEQKSTKTISKLRESSNYKLHNHVQGNFHICNKKALFYNMRAYYQAIEQDPFEFIPLTFHIREGISDKEWERFIEQYSQIESQMIENEKLKNKIIAEKLQQEFPKVIRNIWIIKPGETTNRGNGIQVAQDKKMIQDIVSTKEQHSNGKRKTFIIQKYLDKPLLYKQRKFDIRCYMLITTYNGIIKGYWHQDGYIRTSSKEFTLRNLDNKFIHLTNDAIQKKGEEFGKFEIGNKLSYNEFQRYMDAQTANSFIKYNFQEMTYQDMKAVATDCVKAIFKKLEPQKKQFSFELFGMDFMIDENYKTWLIEVNTNPCLETTCPLLGRVITGLLENVFKIAVDPIFPPPNFPKSRKHLVPENIYESNKFELIFDEIVDSAKLSHLPDKDEKSFVYQKVDEVQEEDWEEEEIVEQQLLAEDDQDE